MMNTLHQNKAMLHAEADQQLLMPHSQGKNEGTNLMFVNVLLIGKRIKDGVNY